MSYLASQESQDFKVQANKNREKKKKSRETVFWSILDIIDIIVNILSCHLNFLNNVTPYTL